MADWQLFARGSTYKASKGLRLSSLDGVTRHLGVDEAQVETPYSEESFALTAPGLGLIANRDGATPLSGLVASERTMGWDSRTGQPTIKVSIIGDTVHAADRLSLPDPLRAMDDQTVNDYWTPRDDAGNTINVPASTAIWRLINEQLGPAAAPGRRVPGLTMGPDPGVGTNRLWRALFENVAEAARVFSSLSGLNLGVRITPVQGGGLRADVVVPRDLTGTIKFSADLTNLVGFEYREKAPTCTVALVPGQGDLHLRLRRFAASTNPLDLRWGRRIERLFDRRDEADADKLAQYAADAIVDGAGQIGLTCTLTDSQAATYGVDWGLGDRVTVYVGLPDSTKLATVADVVREIRFQVDNDGAETITPAIGTTDATALIPDSTQEQLAAVGRRLEGLITRK